MCAFVRASRFSVGGHRGSAVLPVLLLMFLFSAVSLSVAVAVQVEVRIASRFADAAPAVYAAEAALAAAIAELRMQPSWTPVLAGTLQSAYTDGAFGGTKSVPGGGPVLICCGMRSAIGRLTTETAASPRPARRATRWQPFLWAPFRALLPEGSASPLYVIVWAGDDEEDGDGVPQVDSNGILLVRAEAIGQSGVRRIVEAYVERRSARLGGDGDADEGAEDAEDTGAAEEAPGEDAEAGRDVPAVEVRGWREVR